MNKKDLEFFKKKLEQEKKLLEEELKTVGRKDPQNPGGWSATPNDADEPDSADENIVADKMEALEENSAIMTQLEKQLRDVSDALAKISAGTYGVCEVSGEEIERERLEANPSARTSVKHMKG